MAKSRTRAKADKAEIVGRRNILINGGFQVSQRGDYTTATATASNTYYLDRWKRKGATPAATVQDLSGTVKMLATSSETGQMQMQQDLDPVDNYKISGKTLTFSALVKSNSTNCRLLYEASGAGGWGSETVSHSGNGQYERLSVTFTMPAITDSISVRVYVGIDGADAAAVSITTGDYFEASEVQLELGSVATDFENRSYGEELALCQRYYERAYVTVRGGYTSGDYVRPNIQYSVTKRTQPTVVQTSQAAIGGVSYNGSNNQISTMTVNLDFRCTSSGSNVYNYSFFSFDAEI